MMNRYSRTLLSIVIFSGTVVLLSGCWKSASPERPPIAPATPYASPVTASPTPRQTNSNMANTATTDDKPMASGGFFENVPANFERPSDDVGNRLLKEYGAIFIARGGATPPATVIFRDESDVSAFQGSLSKASGNIGGVSIELQSPAMVALKKAELDAKSLGKSITPRGADAARRNYTGTVELWKSRVDPGLAHWTGKGRITSADAARIKALSAFGQVPEIFKLEAQGIFFAKDLSKSIIYSVAPPGTSQHLSMLALDITEHTDPTVRSVLAKQGWYQTVVSDLPHFTFLGVSESELSGLGLKKVSDGGRDYWLPSL